MKTFKYKIPRGSHRPAPAYNAQTPSKDEQLSGIVLGLAASDIEERFARALDRDNRVTGYSFRVPVITGRNLPGQLEVDYVIQTGPVLYLVQIDGEFSHKGQSKRQEDAIKDAIINEFYAKYGASPVQRIDGQLLSTQQEANNLVKDML